MDEFELIERIRARVGAAGAGSERAKDPAKDPAAGRGADPGTQRGTNAGSTPIAGLLTGIGDDCAVLERPDGPVAVSTDTLNFGVHFDRHTTARDLGHKALAVNLSDLAAMGAKPRWALLNLSLPDRFPDGFSNDQSGEPAVDASGDRPDTFLSGFMTGFLELAERHRVTLVGGDTCAGPLSVTVTVIGDVGSRPLTRGAARPGQRVVVSGALGGAALALEQRLGGFAPSAGLAARLDRPQPRVELGRALARQSRVGACIDLSDGLLADLGHIVAASDCGAILELDALPAEPELETLEPERRWELQLTGGDDYELCFTVDEETWEELRAGSAAHGLALTGVGRIEAGADVRCLRPDGTEFRPRRRGYRHFSAHG